MIKGVFELIAFSRLSVRRDGTKKHAGLKETIVSLRDDDGNSDDTVTSQ